MSQIPVSLDFNIGYNISRGIILFCFLLLPIPMLHIFYNICFKKRKRVRSDSILYEEKPHFIQSKVILSLALFFYAAYVTIIAYDTIGKYINLGFTNKFCKIEYAMSGLIFLTAKALLYNYFILRANDTFYNTAYQFSLCFVQSVLPIGLLCLYAFMLPVMYWILYLIHYSVQSTPYNNGQICVLSITQNIDIEHVLQILFSIGGCFEIIFSCITLFLLFNKLIIIIQSTTKNLDHYVQKKPSIVVHEEQNDPRSLVMNLSGVRSYKDEPDPDQSHTNTTLIADRIVTFHADTTNNNALLLLITKLLTLLIVQIISVLISMTLFLFTKMIWFPYVMDSICDIYCLWLTFKFSERYYYEYFCGIKCAKWLFPFVKTCAISVRYSCCDCCIDNNNIDDFHGSSLYYPICRCCWCLFCCTRCYKVKDKKRRIYKCVKGEMDILLSTKLDHKPRTDHDVWN